MDVPSRSKWYAYSHARDQMLEAMDTEHAPWHIVRSDDKRRGASEPHCAFAQAIDHAEGLLLQ